MNDNAKAWVAALRSGKYQQGRDYLCKDNRYCCLGVACEVLGIGKIIDGMGVATYLGDEPNDKDSGWLPRNAKEALGLRTYNGTLGDGATSLTLLNDNGATFNEIADIIESEPEGLFVK